MFSSNRWPLATIATCTFWVAMTVSLLADAQLNENSSLGHMKKFLSWVLVGGPSVFWAFAEAGLRNKRLSDGYKVFCFWLPFIAIPLFVFKSRGLRGLFVWLRNLFVVLFLWAVTVTIIEKEYGVFGIVKNA